MHTAKLLNTLPKTAVARVFPDFLPRRIGLGQDGERHSCWLQGTDPKNVLSS